MKNEKILLLIPAYRDLELKSTIKSALKNADKPENLRFAILNQYGPETKNVLSLFRGGEKRFKIVEVPWQEAKGVGWARHLLEDLYRDEEYVLQIDAHMLFYKGWDTVLKDNMAWCKDERAVISSYPVKYEYDKDGKVVIETTERSRVELHPGKGRYVFESGVIKVPEDDKSPVKTLYATGGLEFYKGEMLRDVRYNAEIIFAGEEVVRSAQLFTFGYNIYEPIGLPIYHHYGRMNHHKFWKDMCEEPELKEYYMKINKRSDEIVDAIMSGNISGFEQYFGEERPITDFLNLYQKDKEKQR